MRDSVLLALEALERELHGAHVRGSRERLAQLLDPQFREFGRSGALYTRAQVIDQLVAETQPTQVHAEGFAAFELSPSVVLLTYRSADITASGSLARHANRSSVWRLESSGWRMVFHQATPTEPFTQNAA